MPNRWTAIATLALVTATAGLSANAQQPKNVGPWVFGVQGGVSHQFSTAMDKGGDVDATRWFIQPSVGYAWDRRTSVSLSIGGGETYYGFSGATGFGGGDPWDTIRDMRISLPIRFAASDDIDVIIVPSVRTNVEAGASLDDGRTEGAIVGARWQITDSFAIGPGVGWFSELGGGSNVFPFLIIDWDITDRISLSTGQGIGATQGPGLSLTWEATDKIKVGVAGRYESARFRLDSDNTTPDGYGEDDGFPLVATLEYSPLPNATLSAFAGVKLAGELKVEDSSGKQVDSTDYDPAPMAGFSFRVRF